MKPFSKCKRLHSIDKVKEICYNNRVIINRAKQKNENGVNHFHEKNSFIFIEHKR
jgi:hypothetical protein